MSGSELAIDEELLTIAVDLSKTRIPKRAEGNCQLPPRRFVNCNFPEDWGRMMVSFLVKAFARNPNSPTFAILLKLDEFQP
jgi:hypothetical protein